MSEISESGYVWLTHLLRSSADTGEVTDYEDAQPPRAFKRHAAASTSKKVYPKQPVKKTITTLDQ